MLDTLPAEILDGVFEQICCSDDLINLCLVSKAICSRAQLCLYASCPLVIRPASDGAVYQLRLDQWRKLASQPERPLWRTRGIRISLEHEGADWIPCFQEHEDLDAAAQAEGEPARRDDQVAIHAPEDGVAALKLDDAPDQSRIMAGELLPVLDAVKPGGLEQFSWELSVCIPREILGVGGWVARKQASILSLQLTTSGSCLANLAAEADTAVDLSPFGHLRSFGWAGLLTRAELKQARMLLERNAGSLERLELDFIDSQAFLWLPDQVTEAGAELIFGRPHESDEPDHDDDEAERVHPVPEVIRLPMLSALSLSNTSLYSMAFMESFDLERLTELTIRNCRGLAYLLNVLAMPENRARLRLKTFDMVTDAVDANSSEEEAITDFLESFAGLESLYMHAEAMLSDWDAILLAAAVHRDTLRRLSYEVVSWHDNAQYEYPEDVGTMGLGAEDRKLAAEDNVLAQLDLYSLGLTGHTGVLKAVLQPVTRRPESKIKLLYLRQPGPEMRSNPWVVKDKSCPTDQGGRTASSNQGAEAAVFQDSTITAFVDWIFGSDGLRSVELVAIGDFSCRGRFLDWSFLVYRIGDGPTWAFYPTGYVPHAKRIPRLEQLLKTNRRFLESAQTDSLLSLRHC